PGPLAGRCSNDYVVGEPGSTLPGPNDPTVNNQNGLHWLRPLVPGDVNYPGQSELYHAGHPNPTRGNPLGAGLYRNGVYLAPGDPALPVDWPPVDPLLAQPAECDFRNPGETDNSLTSFGPSTNGISEYTAHNFAGALRGNLLLAGYTGNLYRVVLTPDGTGTLNCPPNPASCTDSIASGFGRQPLDVTALGPSAPFPGTIWIANIGSSSITVLEPVDYEALAPAPAVPCAERVAGSALGDADGDGYTNQDEAQSGTNPCSAASRPNDADADASSDRADPDDDNDGIADVADPFPLDADNGLSTRLPLEYEFFSAYPGTGLYGLGFTGLMSNGSSDYLDLFDAEEVIAGGTSGLLTIPSVGTGDARGADNSQRNAFLLGVDPRLADSSGGGTFSVSTKINGPFFNGVRPTPNQSLGLFLGTGTQDDYVKLVLEDERGLSLVSETAGSVEETAYPDAGESLLAAISITLFLTVDPVLGSVQPAYLVEGGQRSWLGAPILLSGAVLDAVRGNAVIGARPVGLAVGLIATSRGATQFGASWDYLKVTRGE
ncbi:MAG TPA: thrombospondin type 3 repeat-containing protein, partial [Polyangiaceae bacterium]|nr:thrombospondin type 3 repeat-containing protein [Polyangiaceae bacterium]